MFFFYTVRDIVSDKLTALSVEHWAPSGSDPEGSKKKSFDASLVEKIYYEELEADSDSPLSLQKTMILELSHYLEK